MEVKNVDIQKDVWEEVKFEETPVWEYSEENNEFVGLLIGVKTGLGENNATLYQFRKNNENVGVWGSSVLNSRLEHVSIGSVIKIEYLGLKQSEKNKARSYHDFKVFLRTQKE